MPRVELPRPVGAKVPQPTLVHAVSLAVRDRPLVWFVALNTGYWFLYTQFTLTLPLYALQSFGGLEVVSAYYLVNSLPAVFLQYPLLEKLNRRWSAALIMVAGMLCIALGIG